MKYAATQSRTATTAKITTLRCIADKVAPSSDRQIVYVRIGRSKGLDRGGAGYCTVAGMSISRRRRGPPCETGLRPPRTPPAQRPRSADCLLYTSDAADDLTRVDLG